MLAMPFHDPEFLRKAADARSRIVELSAKEVDEHRLQGGVLVDVRSAPEYAEGHLDGALSLALERLQEEIQEQLPDRSTPIVCYCNGGNRGALAADALQNLGYTNVYSLAGGLSAYQEVGRFKGSPSDL